MKKVAITSESVKRALRWLADAASNSPVPGALKHIRRLASYDNDVVLLAATDVYRLLCAELDSEELAQAEASILPRPATADDGSEEYTTIDEDPDRFVFVQTIAPKGAPSLRVTVFREDLLKTLEGMDDKWVQFCIFNDRLEVRSKSARAVRQYALLWAEVADGDDVGEEERWWKPELLK